ncbi:MAG: hypothetical protein WD512_13225 [Candidatus Paceibacterota bacterium]
MKHQVKMKLIKDKRGIELRYWVVSLILFSGVFALMIIAFHDAADGYGVTNITNSEIEERYNQLSEQESLVENLQETTGGEEGLQILNLLGTVFTATIGVLNLVLASVTFIPTVFANFASDFGIPTQVTNIFFTIAALIITVLIIFAILNAIKR